MSNPVAIGIDLGATNLKVAAVDSTGVIIAQTTAPIAHPEPNSVIAEMVRAATQLCAEVGTKTADLIGVGVGAPGPLSPSKGRIIRSANLPGWVDVPLASLLQQQLGTQVLLENDGNAAAFGEYWAGSSGKCQNLVMLTLGTGVGAGVVIDGCILHGHFENAAELGHMIVVPDGLACPCGQRGCLEQYASASAVAKRATQAIREGEPCMLKQRFEDDKRITAEHVAEAAGQKDALCTRIWDEACHYLAIACVNIQHIYNPEIIFLGGGMSEAGDLLINRVAEAVAGQRWTLHEDIPAIRKATLGYDAGVIGAAGLIWNAHKPA